MRSNYIVHTCTHNAVRFYIFGNHSAGRYKHIIPNRDMTYYFHTMPNKHIVSNYRSSGFPIST